MKILITGAAGYLGGRLAEHLSKKHSIRVLVNRSCPEYLNQYEVYQDDIIDIDLLKDNVCDGVDVVIHCAAMNEKKAELDMQQACLVNCGGTLNLLEAARAAKVKKFIYLSTFHVYGVNSGTITENMIPNPQNIHGKTHLIAEDLCRLYSLDFDVIVLRFSNGIGRPISYDVKRWDVLVNECCHSAVLSNEINMNSNGMVLRDFVSIVDLCQVIDIMIKNKSVGVYNVGSGKSTLVKDVVLMIQDECKNIFNKKIKVNTPKYKKPKVLPMKFSVKKLKMLGYKPKTNIRYDIKETLMMCSDYINSEYNRA